MARPCTFTTVHEGSIVFPAIHYFPVLPRIVWCRDGGPFVPRSYSKVMFRGEMSFQSCRSHRFSLESIPERIRRARKREVNRGRKGEKGGGRKGEWREPRPWSFFGNLSRTSEKRRESAWIAIIRPRKDHRSLRRRIDIHSTKPLRVPRKFSLQAKWRSRALCICQASPRAMQSAHMILAQCDRLGINLSRTS